MAIYLAFAGGVGVAQHFCSGEIIETAFYSSVEPCKTNKTEKQQSESCDQKEPTKEKAQKAPCCEDEYHLQKTDDAIPKKTSTPTFYLLETPVTTKRIVEHTVEKEEVEPKGQLLPHLSGRDILNRDQRYII